MTSRALILVVALTIGSPADAQNCTPHFQDRNPCPDPAFQNQICYMDHFDPDTLDPNGKKPYNTPSCVAGAVSATYTTLLTNAYHLAPSNVKAALCQLHRIYVTTDASYSKPRPPIGVWEAPGRGGHVWIAIPDYILDNASSLDHAENGILGGLFFTPKPPAPPAIPYPSYPPQDRSLPKFFSQPGTPSQPEAEILAVLAHELGHIVLADTNADGPPGNPGPGNRPCGGPPAPSCFTTYFLAGWNGVAPQPAPAFQQRRWIAFNVPNPSVQSRTPTPGFAGIASDIALNTPAGDTRATMDTYREIYGGPTFVSVFAALSPEEDYVETYKYKTLGAAQTAGGGSLNLSISFPNQYPPADVLKPLRPPVSAGLQNKINCVP
jgi:hypothetical protein